MEIKHAMLTRLLLRKEVVFKAPALLSQYLPAPLYGWKELKPQLMNDESGDWRGVGGGSTLKTSPWSAV
jgi:hypothetical protein